MKNPIKRRIVKIEGNTLTYEVVKPLLFNWRQRDIINHHKSKFTEWYLLYTFYRVCRWLR